MSFFVKLQDERNVIFPKPILELCSEQVLVESFEHGTSIGTLIEDLDSTPIDSRKRLAAKGAVHVLLSRFYPDFFQILSRFYPDFLKTHFIQMLSRFYPNY